MNLFELHQRMTAHLFPSYSSTDERFLALALCGEGGELANHIKKRWRDGADLSEEIMDEIADIRVYLELLAKCFDFEGEKLENAAAVSFVNLFDRNSIDERFISLVLCNSIGKFGDIIEARWRSDSHSLGYELARSQIVLIRCYVEIMAIIFGIEGKKLDGRVEQKLQKVVEKHNIKPYYGDDPECIPGN